MDDEYKITLNLMIKQKKELSSQIETENIKHEEKSEIIQKIIMFDGNIN